MLFVNTRTVDWLIACALLIAIVANGTSALLKRVGALDAASYERFIAAYCMPGTALGLASPRCSCMTGAETVALARGLPSAAPEPISRRYVYTTEGYWRFLKPIKDLFFVALLTVGVGVAIRRCGYLTRWRAAPLPWALLASVLLAAGGVGGELGRDVGDCGGATVHLFAARVARRLVVAAFAHDLDGAVCCAFATAWRSGRGNFCGAFH